MRPFGEWFAGAKKSEVAEVVDDLDKIPEGMCANCEENPADPDFICRLCDQAMCDDCLVKMTYKNQCDETICKSCYGSDE